MRELNFRAWNKTRLWMDNVWAIDWEHELLCFSKHNQDFMKHCILMQSTGLKDKNGVEIYEGDIVDYGAFDLSVIKFEDGIFWARLGQYPINVVHSDIEVKGNIYEHPHLLENSL